MRQQMKHLILSEGVTGAVVGRRGTVVFDDYAEVPGGHVPAADRVSLRGVIGVPIWWRKEIIGSCVVFSRDPERVFTSEDAGLLELFAKHAALAITYARLHERAETTARAEAAAEERNRMAREVHDTVAKGLVSVLLHLRSAEADLAAGRRGRARGRGRRGPRGGPVRARGDAAQRARARAVAARGPLARGGPRAGAGVGEPDRDGRRPPRGGREAGAAAHRGGARALPDRPGGADQRAPPRRGPLGADRDRLRPVGGHPARPGRRGGVRPRRGRAGGGAARHGPARHGRAGAPGGRLARAGVHAGLGDPRARPTCRAPATPRRPRRAPASGSSSPTTTRRSASASSACWPTSSRPSRSRATPPPAARPSRCGGRCARTSS